jgi:hypothetical protein
MNIDPPDPSLSRVDFQSTDERGPPLDSLEIASERLKVRGYEVSSLRNAEVRSEINVGDSELAFQEPRPWIQACGNDVPNPVEVAPPITIWIRGPPLEPFTHGRFQIGTQEKELFQTRGAARIPALWDESMVGHCLGNILQNRPSLCDGGILIRQRWNLHHRVDPTIFIRLFACAQVQELKLIFRAEFFECSQDRKGACRSDPRPLLDELRCVFFQAASRLGRYNSARDV